MNSIPSRRLNVLVRYPDPLVSAGLAAALRQQPGFRTFVQDAQALMPGVPSIDVIIADHGHAMQLVESAARRLVGPLAGARILALTANDRETDIRRAIEAGIHGYLLLGCSLDELADGVRTVGSGMRYLCLAVAQRVADSVAGATLTARENDVLRLVATGQSNKAIARQLDIGLGTVKSHVSSIMTKLDAKSRTQAAGIAVSRGLVDHSSPERSVPRAARTIGLEAPSQFA